ncbi:MAG: hypothetical protein ACRDFB_03265 [Rhabdochlamydiaceae bacterium]
MGSLEAGFGVGASILGSGFDLFDSISAQDQFSEETQQQQALETQEINAEKAEIGKEKDMEQEQQEQPTLIQAKAQQEKNLQQISNKNSTYANPVNYSTMGGLKGKL